MFVIEKRCRVCKSAATFIEQVDAVNGQIIVTKRCRCAVQPAKPAPFDIGSFEDTFDVDILLPAY
jgi:hypothetical protein